MKRSIFSFSFLPLILHLVARCLDNSGWFAEAAIFVAQWSCRSRDIIFMQPLSLCMNYQYKHLGLWNGEYRGEGSTGTVWLFEIISGRVRLPFASSFVCQTLPLENLPPERNTSVTPLWAVSSRSEIKAQWKPALEWGGRQKPYNRKPRIEIVFSL